LDAEGNEGAQQDEQEDSWLAVLEPLQIGLAWSYISYHFRSLGQSINDGYVSVPLSISSLASSKGELSFPWNLLLYGYKTIIPFTSRRFCLLLLGQVGIRYTKMMPRAGIKPVM
jgi:hypothetical protein